MTPSRFTSTVQPERASGNSSWQRSRQSQRLRSDILPIQHRPNSMAINRAQQVAGLFYAYSQRYPQIGSQKGISMVTKYKFGFLITAIVLALTVAACGNAGPASGG